MLSEDAFDPRKPKKTPKQKINQDQHIRSNSREYALFAQHEIFLNRFISFKEITGIQDYSRLELYSLKDKQVYFQVEKIPSDILLSLTFVYRYLNQFHIDDPVEIPTVEANHKLSQVRLEYDLTLGEMEKYFPSVALERIFDYLVRHGEPSTWQHTPKTFDGYRCTEEGFKTYLALWRLQAEMSINDYLGIEKQIWLVEEDETGPAFIEAILDLCTDKQTIQQLTDLVNIAATFGANGLYEILTLKSAAIFHNFDLRPDEILQECDCDELYNLVDPVLQMKYILSHGDPFSRPTSLKSITADVQDLLSYSSQIDENKLKSYSELQVMHHTVHKVGDKYDGDYALLPVGYGRSDDTVGIVTVSHFWRNSGEGYLADYSLPFAIARLHEQAYLPDGRELRNYHIFYNYHVILQRYIAAMNKQ
jgi:hypothetical protein